MSLEPFKTLTRKLSFQSPVKLKEIVRRSDLHRGYESGTPSFSQLLERYVFRALLDSNSQVVFYSCFFKKSLFFADSEQSSEGFSSFPGVEQASWIFLIVSGSRRFICFNCS